MPVDVLKGANKQLCLSIRRSEKIAVASVRGTVLAEYVGGYAQGETEVFVAEVTPIQAFGVGWACDE